MIRVLSEIEGEPAARPTVTPWPRGDRTAVDEPIATVDDAMTWQRIEAWIAHRWGARSVVYIVEGPGVWEPRLAPFSLTGFDRWDGAAWAADTASPAPLGYWLDAGTFRATGTAGDASTPPAAVLEAWRRLHEFAFGIAQNYGAEAAVYQDDAAHGGTSPASWAAKAIHLSGAADLLRPWRRLGA